MPNTTQAKIDERGFPLVVYKNIALQIMDRNEQQWCYCGAQTHIPGGRHCELFEGEDTEELTQF